MFKRTKSAAVPETPQAPAKPGGKGRPTPTRKEAEAAARARARAPRDKKELARRQREFRAEESRKIRQGMKSGDERYFLPRDKGPVRRFIRDYVDRRFSIVEMVIPLMIIGLILGYTGNTALVQASSLILLATVLFVVTDMFVLRFRIRRELRKRFPEESLKGTTYYAITRSMQMKFMRLPKARIKIGQALPEDYDR
ncbi:Protein of unknown function (DUF3043) [Nocardioides sp. J9]|uniref:DUF3043 domain-containing protein n=1 Tax=unclassified Nocardioides TaxID=2615069 RepID=UPI00048C7C7D|nr:MULTISPECIES: DUF3043 domain-containing protein [unclassified Nocardioides]TWG89886.1 Protein of unknown function (DUF3043) [Nocardioides sp. J9]